MQPFRKTIVFSATTYMIKMKPYKLLLFLVLFSCVAWSQDQEDNTYIEFNDRNNVVHGVYLGLGTYFGEIDGENTYHGVFKIAYVANRQFEVGFAAVGFYSEQDIRVNTFDTFDFAGAYGGLHIEPILWGRSKANLSFPILIGAGGVVYVEENNGDVEIDLDKDDSDEVFVFEPGINFLYNLSRFVQLEVGMRYRFSSRIKLEPNEIKNINGFSAGFGIKVGIFNMGRNRYKKHLGNE
ncbi:hypothetical protein [Flagellimonas sp. 389]|uniref:hypothetical protein n=1 Tax=Flagellimonas sp. 389 TaxID=2835862 RepID=UPI001BD452B3|nr:hypothetical protein [Flagellimonas sp. 389]